MAIVDRDLRPRRRERKHSSRRTVLGIAVTAALILAATIGFTVSMIGNGGSDSSEDPADTPARILYTLRGSIWISGNSGFIAANGVVGGSGTASDPYIIAGWEITNSGLFASIYIVQTTAHFVIRDCYIHNYRVSYMYDGIYLMKCSNGILEDNIISNNCRMGVVVSTDTVLNTNITIRNNVLSSNGMYGIHIQGVGLPYGNTIANNTISNQGYGIVLQPSSNNEIFGNAISSNLEYGVTIYSGTGNRIWNNSFSSNNCGDVQAYDAVFGNFWNTSGIPHGYGNRWSDWVGPDEDYNGIVDVPYILHGGKSSTDYYPLTDTPPEPIPEFGSTPLLAMSILVTMVIVVRAMRRRTP